MFAPDADPRRHRLLTGTRDLTHRRSYYLAQFQRQGGGSGLALFWPDQYDVGVHGNIIQQYAPEMEKRLCWQWRRPRSASWRIDETSIKVRGQWAYLSRALDKFGSTIDFYLSATRNTKAAKRFLGKALRGWQDWERPVVLNTDKAPTYVDAIAKLKAEGKCPDETRHRQVKYLNNVPGRDHGKLNASRGVSALPAEGDGSIDDRSRRSCALIATDNCRLERHSNSSKFDTKPAWVGGQQPLAASPSTKRSEAYVASRTFVGIEPLSVFSTSGSSRSDVP